VSKTSNELERFASSILLSGKKLSQTLVEALKANKVTVLDDLGDDVDGTPFEPKYLEKNLQGVKDFTNEFVKQMEQWYRDSTKTINVSDEKFGTVEAGIALKLKLIPMEFRASQIETYFNQGLMRRLKYYADVFNASLNTKIKENDYTTIIKSQRNVPVDDAAIVEMISKLDGMLSDLTLLEAMPKSIVPDPEKELKRKEEEVEDLDLIPIAGAVGEESSTVQATEAVKLSGIQIAAANDIITLVGLPLDAGGITREAAIQQLTIFLGLTKEQAEKVLGNKQTGAAKSKVSEGA